MKFKNKIEVKCECLFIYSCLLISAYAARPLGGGVGGSSFSIRGYRPNFGSVASVSSFNPKSKFFRETSAPNLGTKSRGPSLQTFDAQSRFSSRPFISFADVGKSIGSGSGFYTRPSSSSSFATKTHSAFTPPANSQNLPNGQHQRSALSSEKNPPTLDNNFINKYPQQPAYNPFYNTEMNAESRISHVTPSAPSSGLKKIQQGSSLNAKRSSSVLSAYPTLSATKAGLSASLNQTGVNHFQQGSTLSSKNPSSFLNTSSTVAATNVGLRAPLNESSLNQFQPRPILNGNNSTFVLNNSSTVPAVNVGLSAPSNKSGLNQLQQGLFLNGKNSSSLLNISSTFPNIGLSATRNQSGISHFPKGSILNGLNSSSALNVSSNFAPTNIPRTDSFNQSGLGQLQHGSSPTSKNSSSAQAAGFLKESIKKISVNGLRNANVAQMMRKQLLSPQNSLSVSPADYINSFPRFAGKGYTTSAINNHNTLKLQKLLKGEDENQPNHGRTRLIIISALILFINLTIGVILFTKLKK